MEGSDVRGRRQLLTTTRVTTACRRSGILVPTLPTLLVVAAGVARTSAEDVAVEEESGCGPLCEEAAMWNAMAVAMMALCIVCGEHGFH